MCWTGNINDWKIAKKDVKVFKAIYKRLPDNVKDKTRYYAPLTCYEYELNKLYEVEPLVTRNHTCSKFCDINAGIHTFSMKCEIKKISTFYALYYAVVGYQFRMIKFMLTPLADNFFKEVPDLMGNFHLIFLECIIPAGTKYYENANGEIVSNKLFITDKIINGCVG